MVSAEGPVSILCRIRKKQTSILLFYSPPPEYNRGAGLPGRFPAVINV